jgi:aryl-alcohol dehydrogenase-like predicted oxidoreductase
MIKNICLGTANFGEKYGLKNNNKINANEIKNFFLYMRKKKITFVDTAFSYKGSHKIIKDNLKSDIKIITKLPIPKKKINNIYQWIIRKVIKEQIYFNSQIDTLLLHDTKILNKKKNCK